MADSHSTSFCSNEPFWDTDATWNSSRPRFTDCFLRTVPIWIPAAFLWITGLSQLYYIYSSRSSRYIRSIPLNCANGAKLILALLLAIVSLLQFSFDLHYYIHPDGYKYDPINWADLSGSIINVATFILLALLLHAHRLAAYHTSGIIWFFAFGTVLFSLPSLYTFSMFYRDSTDLISGHSLVLFIFHFSLSIIFFLLACFADARPVTTTTALTQNGSNGNVKHHNHLEAAVESKLSTPLRESPDQSASFISLLTFWWLNALAWVGYKKSLTLEDLSGLSRENCTEALAPRFDAKWYATKAKKGESGVLGTIMRAFAWPLLGGAALKIITEMIQFANPQLQKVFIGFVSSADSSEPVWHGYFLGCMFFVVSTCQSFCSNHYFTLMNRLGMQIKTALISAIYRKSLRLSNKTRRETTSGEIINLMAVDVQTITFFMPYYNVIWSDPMLILAALYFLWQELGISVLAGFAVMLLMIPFNATTTRYQGRFQAAQMKKKDERVKVINELLSGVKVIKLYGWELPFISRVSEIRGQEVGELKKMAFLNAVTYIMWTTAPFLVALCSFTAYVLSSEDHVLDAQKAFVSLSLFEVLRIPLNSLPTMITQLVMALVSIKRLNRFLNASELEDYVTREESKEDAITIKDGTFAWDQEEQLTLNSINLRIPRGSLVAIVGQVGSGKSSLLSAILGDMERIKGTVNVNRSSSIAYVAQQAWIRNATLKDNILFGHTFVGSRYESVVEMCALKPDLAILPGGDQTEIGEKGINLSGGQKQRVAIARACYDTADIVLLDDPLSAVDSHVAKHIFTQVLSNKTGYLKDRTRVLATNNISILPDVDTIIVLSNKGISEIGSYQQLMANSGKFAEFVREHSETLKEKEEVEEILKPQKFLRSESVISAVSSASSLRHRAGTLTGTVRSIDEFNPAASSELIEPEPKDELIKSETAETGRVKITNYLIYFKSYTVLWCVIILAGFISKQLAAVGSNVWLALWSNDKLHGINGTQNAEDIAVRNTRLGVYAALGVTQGITVAIGSLGIAIATVKSSVSFHSRLFDRIMRSPMRFFDTTPLGRVVNRFSKDIDAVDTAIPQSLQAMIFCMLEVISTVIYIVVQVPIFLVIVLPTMFLYYWIQKFYLSTSRQLKRLESITRSPIYSHFGETLQGASTIRAYSQTDRFIDDSNRRVDTNQRCYYPSFIANSWLRLRLEFCGNLILLFAAIFAVIYRDSFKDSPGFVGLIITYSFTVTLNLNWMVRMTSEMETNVVSVERISEYCEVETEREWSRPENRDPVIPPNWPLDGAISFSDYSVRYRDGLDLVLSDVDLSIRPREKIGIVGRTGSGKSTLTLALFRILEAAAGRIEIDGVEIGKIGLHELRSILSIIPQDPVLFSGTIRSNLDPFNVYTDAQLWEALKHSHLQDYIASLDAGLDYIVAENGENLSIGQRQLICLARALLRKTKILVLDEATAAIDLETDALIQETIRSEFADCTILTIAHRLNTIMDSTRVLVMDKGRVAEFDSPERLLANKKSSFYSLAKDAGLV